MTTNSHCSCTASTEVGSQRKKPPCHYRAAGLSLIEGQKPTHTLYQQHMTKASQYSRCTYHTVWFLYPSMCQRKTEDTTIMNRAGHGNLPEAQNQLKYIGYGEPDRMPCQTQKEKQLNVDQCKMHDRNQCNWSSHNKG